jgi:hypothetical protein
MNNSTADRPRVKRPGLGVSDDSDSNPYSIFGLAVLLIWLRSCEI